MVNKQIKFKKEKHMKNENKHLPFIMGLIAGVLAMGIVLLVSLDVKSQSMMYKTALEMSKIEPCSTN